jgi:lipopolysaccharide transport system permease protein
MNAASSLSLPHRLSTPLVEGLQAFGNFLRHRDLLWQMVGNDLRGRYVGSFFGVFWNILHPLVQIAIYTLIFSQVMGARLGGNSSPFAFSIYLCAGLLPWLVFAEIINRCTSVFWDNANVVKKIAFPKVLLHTYIFVAGAVNLAILVILFLIFLAYCQELPAFGALLVWASMLIVQLVFALGIGLLTSVLNVFFRDMAQIVGVLLQFWFWLTPIVYVPDVLPAAFRGLLAYNLVARLTQIHQGLILHGTLPRLEECVLLGLIAGVTLGLGLVCFWTLRRRIPDEL